MLRSCYTTRMQFDQAGIINVPVRWYFCDDAAQTLPAGTLFYSKNWDTASEGWPPGVGEIWPYDRTWSNGANPGMNGQGSPCGPTDWFVNGCPSNAPPLTIQGGVPLCCRQPNYKGSIGMAFGLQSSLTPCFEAPIFRTAYVQFGRGGWIEITGTYFSILAYDYAFSTYGLPYTITITLGAEGARICMAAYDSYYFRDPQTVALGPVALAYVDPPIYHVTDPYLEAWYHTSDFYFTFDLPPQSGSLGIKFGLSSRVVSYNGSLGLKFGLMAGEKASQPGTLGLQLGLASAASARYGAALGIEWGVEGTSKVRYAGSLGLKLGLASTLKGHYAGSLGLKLGLVSTSRVRYAGTVGIEWGLASTNFAGILTQCCTPHPTPVTLHWSIAGGNSGTTTYSSSAGGWSFADSTSGFAGTLKCVLSGSTWSWTVTANTGGCTASTTITSIVCHPFALSVHVVIAGSHCLFPANVNITYSA
jgi:hypothetical protein